MNKVKDKSVQGGNRKNSISGQTSIPSSWKNQNSEVNMTELQELLIQMKQTMESNFVQLSREVQGVSKDVQNLLAEVYQLNKKTTQIEENVKKLTEDVKDTRKRTEDVERELNLMKQCNEGLMDKMAMLEMKQKENFLRLRDIPELADKDLPKLVSVAIANMTISYIAIANMVEIAKM